MITPLAQRIQSARKHHLAPTARLPKAGIHDLLQQKENDLYDFLTFVEERHPTQKFSYQRFVEEVRKVSSFLVRHEIKRGSRIATMSSNHWRTIVLYFAAWNIGAVVVPINMGEDDERIHYILKNASISMIFIHDDFALRQDALLKKFNDLTDFTWTKYSSLQSLTFDSTQLFPSPEIDDEAFIVYTSGTTGNPKGVILTQRNLLEDANAISKWHELTPDTTMMCVLPIHHVNGTVVTHLTPFIAGASVVLCEKFSVSQFWKLITDQQINIVSLVPTLAQYLTHAAETDPPMVPDHFNHVICGAGPLTVETAQRFEERFQRRIIHGYGLSETTCYSCFLPLDLSDQEHHTWMRSFGYPSIGVPIPPNEMAIHTTEGKPLGEGERGEIVIRGHNVMKEYYANETANEQAFTHGWFRSGDEGFFHFDENERPFFFITGRLKELIIRGGINLAPLEIDEIINRAPGVKAGIAVGFENDWYGEEIGAYVQLHEGVEENASEILEFCRTHLPFSKTPKVVVFGTSIPVTSTGKYQRRKVVSLFTDWKSTQFKSPR